MVHGINGKREGLKCVRKYQEQQQALQTLQKHGKKPHYRHVEHSFQGRAACSLWLGDGAAVANEGEAIR